MPEYAVLDKVTIKTEIMPYFSIAKRGFTSKFDFVEMINAILYKLKSGCQWRLLPTGHLFSGEGPSWKPVFYHFRKWSMRDEWQRIYSRVLMNNKRTQDLSIAHIDGSLPLFIGEVKKPSTRVERNVPLPMPSFWLTIKVSLLRWQNHRVSTIQIFMKYDEEMYDHRWKIERTNAWMDSFKSVLNRFDTTVSSWKGWNFLAFIVIFLNNFHNSN